MRTLIYQLEFEGFVHFGKDTGSLELESADYIMRSDTFYSAICIEMLKIYGEDKFNEFIEDTKKGEMLISDLMPYNDENFYVPKPYFVSDYDKKNIRIEDKKKIKKLKYINIEKISEFYNGYYNFEGDENEKCENDDFAIEKLIWKNSIDYNHMSTPYVVSSFKFKKNAGLYFIIKISDKWNDIFNTLLDSLTTSGIGGKKSIGYGKFKLYDDPIEIFKEEGLNVYNADKIIRDMLNIRDSKYYYLLSTLIPDINDIKILKDSYYHFIKRSGFVDSLAYSSKFLKKKQVAMLSAGSTLTYELKGNIIDLSEHGNHPVYRNGLGFYLGVDLDE